MNTNYPSFSNEPQMHSRPNRNEVFIILKGESIFRFSNEIKNLKKIDRITDKEKNKVV